MVTKDNRVTVNFHVIFVFIFTVNFYNFFYRTVYVNIPRKYFVCERNQNWSSFISLSLLYVSVFSDDIMLWREK